MSDHELFLGWTPSAPAAPPGPSLSPARALPAVLPVSGPSLPVHVPEEVRQDTLRYDSSVANPYTRLGTWADKGAAGRPNTAAFPLTDEELLILHALNGIARRIVELPAYRATRKGWSVPDIPASEDKRLDTWAVCRRAIAMARLWGGAAVLMVTEDDIPRGRFRRDPEGWLQQPLDLRRVGALKTLQVFDAFEAEPWEYDEDVFSPTFRQPRIWRIYSQRWFGLVHASRIAWFRGNERPPSQAREAAWARNRMPDDGVLQVGWDALRRLTETMNAGSVLAAEFKEAILKLGGLASKSASDQADAVDRRLEIIAEGRDLLGLTVIGDGDAYESRIHNPAGFTQLTEPMMRMVAADYGWPQSLLFGDGPGGLATDDRGGRDQERQIYSDCQESNRPPIMRLYEVQYAAQDGPTGGRAPDEWDITFAPLDEPDEKTVAEVRRTVAETDEINIRSGIYGPEVPARQRYGRDGFQIDLRDIPVPDPEARMRRELEHAQQLQQALEGGGDPGRGGGDPGAAGGDRRQQSRNREEDEAADAEARADASGDGTVIVVPTPEPPAALRRAVEEAIGQSLRIPSNPAHVTVLYLGEGMEAEAVAEVVGAVEAEALDTEPHTLRAPVVRSFPPGPDGTPVIVEFEEAWQLMRLNERLLRRLAHLITARQFRRFRAHITLGYAAEPLSAEAMTALAALPAPELGVSVVVLEVRSAEEVVGTVQVGG
jgi:phage-related protein (TIGR01555 family)